MNQIFGQKVVESHEFGRKKKSGFEHAKIWYTTVELHQHESDLRLKVSEHYEFCQNQSSF